ncbi:hypothetical protein QBC46DRAFT_341292 [Diplogelasinospora grovesii]|uniref:Uncharacterized protein n=1 Tax=Diplogelasinospora grovesii TaxID=303347 RepID=A0AAN6N881_9PEZI|nr:hypothetical protein QBC46DRAFT_341292 [Diplogelasinospora grovesii]
MSLWQSYKGLPAKSRLAVGAGLLFWGVVGLYMSDRAEEKFGFTPTEADKRELEKLTPKIQVIDRRER